MALSHMEKSSHQEPLVRLSLLGSSRDERVTRKGETENSGGGEQRGGEKQEARKQTCGDPEGERQEDRHTDGTGQRDREGEATA